MTARMTARRGDPRTPEYSREKTAPLAAGRAPAAPGRRLSGVSTVVWLMQRFPEQARGQRPARRQAGRADTPPRRTVSPALDSASTGLKVSVAFFQAWWPAIGTQSASVSATPKMSRNWSPG